jgi:pyridoxal 5'-phosphate synthase pdxT subunit
VKIGVLALQGDVREHLRALSSAGATAVPVKRPDQLAGVDGLVVPGGESTTIGKLLDRYELLEPVRERALAGMPLWGTCAGLILMAKTITGREDAPHRFGVLDVTVRRNAYGRQTESFETDLDVAGLDEPFRAVFIRAPIIEEAGDGVDVLARFDGKPVLVRSGSLLASTFHPEMTGDCRVHEMFVGLAESL